MNGHLKDGTDFKTAPQLPDGYLSKAESVAERQGTLAGYRLEDELQKYLISGKTVPLLPPNTNTMPLALPKEIGAAQAAEYYDEEMVVTGKVAEVSTRPTVSILDLDQPFPDTPMTAVVFDENFSRFRNLQKYQGYQVKIKGIITEYHDKPEIILESPQQIRIIDANLLHHQ